MLAPGLFVWSQFVTVPDDATEVEVVGQQWQWSFRLPGKDGKLGTSDTPASQRRKPARRRSPTIRNGQDDVIVEAADLHLPVGKPVKMLLRSIDVLHDFYVPRVPRQDGHDPGLGHLFLVHADPDRHLRGAVRRALRHRAMPSCAASSWSTPSRTIRPGSASSRPSHN